MTEPIQTIDKPSLPDPKLSTVDKLRMLLDITKTISRSLDLDEVLTLAALSSRERLHVILQGTSTSAAS